MRGGLFVAWRVFCCCFVLLGVTCLVIVAVESSHGPGDLCHARVFSFALRCLQVVRMAVQWAGAMVGEPEVIKAMALSYPNLPPLEDGSSAAVGVDKVAPAAAPEVQSVSAEPASAAQPVSQ